MVYNSISVSNDHHITTLRAQLLDRNFLIESKLSFELLPCPFSISDAGVEPLSSSIFQPDPSSKVWERRIKLLILEILLVLLGQEFVVINVLAEVSGSKCYLDHREEKRKDEYNLVYLNSDLEQDDDPELGKKQTVLTSLHLLFVLLLMDDLIH